MDTSAESAEAKFVEGHEARHEKWHAEGFSADDVISAFEQGKEKGWNEAFDALDALTIQNIEQARSLVEELFDEFRDVHQLNPRLSFLSLDAVPSRFTALTVIPAERFASDDALTAIRWAKKRLRECSSPVFSMEHLFMPDSEEIDRTLLAAEGYRQRYEPEE